VFEQVAKLRGEFALWALMASVVWARLRDGALVAEECVDTAVPSGSVDPRLE
jgi:hypothetical protein